MRRDIQEALLSVGEVGIFAWSLLELFLTRILPLAGFLAGHLLLQFGRHLTAIIIPAAGRRETRGEYYSWDAQSEGLIEEEDNVLKKYGDHENHDLEGVIESNGKLEERQGQQLLLPSLTAAATTMADAELLDREVHVAELVPSDGEVTDIGASGAPANEVEMRGKTPANEVQVRGNIDGHVAETEPSNLDKREHVSSKGDSGKGVQEASRMPPRRYEPSLDALQEEEEEEEEEATP